MWFVQLSGGLPWTPTFCRQLEDISILPQEWQAKALALRSVTLEKACVPLQKKNQKPRNQNQYSCKESKQTPFKDKSCTSQCFFSKASEKPDLFKQSKPILCQKNQSACCEVTINNVQHFLHLLQLTFINAQENSVMSCGD